MLTRSTLAVVLALLSAPAVSARSPERLAELLRQLEAPQVTVAERDRIREAVDAEAAQRYAWASGLFWHTDLAAAQAAARKSGKPILSLRLLGRLTDELSCANSRFFRTALYANRDISKLLQDKFVLHWSSERPAPVLTLDFGDGRVVRRTVTGNSIHYLLNHDGRPLDALPGLAGPGAFHAWLTWGDQVHTALGRYPADRREALIKGILHQRLSEDQRLWETQLAAVGRSHRPLPKASANNTAAEAAVVVARNKSVVEVKLIPALTMSGEPVRELDDIDVWRDLAAANQEQCRLDERSIALIRWQRPLAMRSDREAPSSPPSADALSSQPSLAAMLARFEENMAIETVRNRYTLQRELRLWLVNAKQPLSLDELNRQVYAELFQTPREDPWLGLMPQDAYSGLIAGGQVSGPASVAVEYDVDSGSRQHVEPVASAAEGRAAGRRPTLAAPTRAAVEVNVQTTEPILPRAVR